MDGDGVLGCSGGLDPRAVIGLFEQVVGHLVLDDTGPVSAV
jgi:hypothetical protein